MITSIIIGVALEGIAAILALKWALPKSDRAFFSIFMGDAFLRLTALGFVTWWLLSRHLPFVFPLITMGSGYLVMSVLQIPFLYKAR